MFQKQNKYHIFFLNMTNFVVENFRKFGSGNSSQAFLFKNKGLNEEMKKSGKYWDSSLGKY